VYQLQLFASDARELWSSRVQYFSDGLGNDSPSFTQNTFTSIVGTFEADAETQDLGLFAEPGSDTILEAYVLRLVPEPSTLPLASFGHLSLLGFCRPGRRWVE